MTAWTEEQRDLLKALWAEGLSGSQIAIRFGTTRNAILGAVNRLGLSGRVVVSKPKREYRPKGAVQQPVAIPIMPAPLDKSGGCTLMELTLDTCRWPNGEVGASDFHFCGGMAVQGLPYCSPHARTAYQRAVK